jgi:hypothetical protein
MDNRHKIKNLKPGAPVILLSHDIKILNENSPSPVEIALKTEIKQGSMRVVLHPSAGLELKNENTTFYFELADKGIHTVTTNLLAATQGRYYVNLQIDIDDGEHLSSRVLAVIVQVGVLQKVSEKFEQAVNSSTADKIISLPAQEVIINP